MSEDNYYYDSDKLIDDIALELIKREFINYKKNSDKSDTK